MVAFETKCAGSEVAKIRRRRQLEISIFYLLYTHNSTINHTDCSTMTSTSKTLTSKVESGSPYRLDANQVGLSLCHNNIQDAID